MCSFESDADLEKLIEQRNQEIHNYKREISLASALNNEYLEEIEALRSQQLQRENTLLKQVKDLEEELTSLDTNNAEELKELETIEYLEEQIKELERKSDAIDVERNETNKTILDQNEVMKEISQVIHNLNEIKEQIDKVQAENVALEEKNKYCISELIELTQRLNWQTEELKEVKTRIKHLQDEISVGKSELDSSKNKPLNPAQQGNSLFAEVNDSRLKLMEMIVHLEKRYKNSKVIIDSKLKEMEGIRAKNLELCGTLDTIIDPDDDNENQIKEFEEKIAELNIKMENCRLIIDEPLEIPGLNLEICETAYGSAVVKYKCNEIVEALKHFNRTSAGYLETFIEYKNSKLEMQSLKRTEMKLMVRNEELENILHKLQSESTSSAVKDDLNQSKT